jgi:hypothetical protein
MKSVTALSFAPVLLAFTAMAQTGSGGGSVGAVITSSGSFVSNNPGMPYSAEEVTEHVQTLADGTHITQTSARTKFYRDSEGRTRIERSFMLPLGAVGDSGPKVIDISDPVSGTHYMLEPRNHTARSVSLPNELPLPPPHRRAPQLLLEDWAGCLLDPLNRLNLRDRRPPRKLPSTLPRGRTSRSEPRPSKGFQRRGRA